LHDFAFFKTRQEIFSRQGEGELTGKMSLNEVRDLYVSHAPKIFYLIRRIVHNTSIAEEILHDTFLQAMLKYHTLKNKDKAVTWLYRIAVNSALNAVKKSKNAEAAAAKLWRQAEYALQEDPLLYLTEQEAAEQIKRGLQQLDSLSFTVLTLFYYEEFTIRQISEILQLAPGTVKSRLHRAKKQLKLYLESNSYQKDKGDTYNEGSL